MKYKPTPKLLIALGVLALVIAATRGGSRSGNSATHHGTAYGNGPIQYGTYGQPFGGGYPIQGGGYGGAADGWYGGNFHSNPNLGTAISTSGDSGYIAIGGGDFVSW